VILGRVQHLSGGGPDVIGVASVIGGEFDPETVESVGGFDVETVDRAVDESLRSGMCEPAPNGAIRFSHALIRDAVYEEMPRRRRIDLHRAIAATLAASFDPARESSIYAEAIAHHFQVGGLIPDAIAYWERAAEIALVRSSHGEQISASRAGDSANPETQSASNSRRHRARPTRDR
jgi:predicted ATPase